MVCYDRSEYEASHFRQVSVVILKVFCSNICHSPVIHGHQRFAYDGIMAPSRNRTKNYPPTKYCHVGLNIYYNSVEPSITANSVRH